MDYSEQPMRTLLVSSNEKMNAALLGMLPETEYETDVATSAAAARQRLSGESYDFVLINAPLTDEFGTQLAVDLPGSCVVLLLVRSELYEGVYAKATDSGVLTLAKPTSPAMLTQALRWMHAVRERLRRMAAKNTSLEEKMADIRLVNRAKWLLITELSMTEPDAHRYIEKQAMDRCVPRRVIAQQIIQMYE